MYSDDPNLPPTVLLPETSDLASIRSEGESTWIAWNRAVDRESSPLVLANLYRQLLASEVARRKVELI
jgi:hypothetical protein